MSHVATVDVAITNLDDLKAAAESLGLEFCEGKTTYEWFGQSIGDTPLPAGYTVDDLGKCQHAIRIPTDRHGESFAQFGVFPYEIGVDVRRDGKHGWVLIWDYYGGGMGLSQFVGERCERLKQAYASAAAKRTMRLQGYRCHEQKLPNGSIQLKFTR